MNKSGATESVPLPSCRHGVRGEQVRNDRLPLRLEPPYFFFQYAVRIGHTLVLA